MSINAGGDVQVTIAGQTASQTVGTLNLATFANEAGLASTGDNLYLATSASGNPVTGNPNSTGFGSVMAGFVETSNGSTSSPRSTNLITAQRAYEMNSRVITTSDQMSSTSHQPEVNA